MLNDSDKKLLSFYMAATNKSATAAEVKNALGYPSVGAVNLHVVRVAKKLASTFSYKPTTRDNGQLRWWPCLFEGNDSKHGFVWTLRQDIKKWYEKTNSIDLFQQKVQLSLQDADARVKRLASALKTPKKRLVQVLDFERNPDVVAEVLFQANGQCQKCGSDAPFFRKSDGTPYLEVHHLIPLALGGKDSVENAIAVCPNCHREAHYG